ncbi:MAG: hypothetical protein J7578_24805 [Chitinophagaceae bacterium]|nr:hypothetical protein [Chitinophagaceae bacterium]
MRFDALKGSPWWHPKTILYCLLVVLGAIFSFFALILTLWPTEDLTPTTAGYSSDKDKKRNEKKKRPSA